MSGGPFQFSPRHNDVGTNLQQAVIHVNHTAGEFYTTGLFWYLAHFSKFVSSGMRQIEIEVAGDVAACAPEGTPGVEAVGFRPEETGMVIVQLLNHELYKDQTITLMCNSDFVQMNLPRASITSATFNLSA